jgi:hypothetical protein
VPRSIDSDVSGSSTVEACMRLGVITNTLAEGW